MDNTFIQEIANKGGNKWKHMSKLVAKDSMGEAVIKHIMAQLQAAPKEEVKAL